MTRNHDIIKFYVDTMIVEALINDPSLVKQATIQDTISAVFTSAKNFFTSQLSSSKESPAATILNFLGPGAIATTLSLIGFPGLVASGIGAAMIFFDINITDILKSIYDKMSGLLKNNEQIEPSKVDDVVDGEIQRHIPDTPAQAAKEEEYKNEQNKDQQRVVTQQLRAARMIKLAIITNSQEIIKTSGFFKLNALKILGTVLSWLWKVALSSAGLLAGTKVIQHAFPSLAPAKKQEPVSKQTKFKVKSGADRVLNKEDSYWAENYPNNSSGISNMLVQFTKDSYDGLDNLDSIIKSTSGFKVIAEEIEAYNHTSAGASVVFLPKTFTTKKSIVDFFIDDVAEKAPVSKSTSTEPPTNTKP